MPNFRGNRYSREHNTLNPDISPGEFWNFSWGEMGTIDLPQVIDKVLALTGKTKLPIIGHSQVSPAGPMLSLYEIHSDKCRISINCDRFVFYWQGASITAVLLATDPTYSEKISCAILIAPFISMYYTKPPISTSLDIFNTFQARNTEFAGNIQNQDKAADVVCSSSGTTCDAFFDFLLGDSTNKRNKVISK